MKSIFLYVLVFLTSPAFVNANCIDGNCQNGKGTSLTRSGVKYMGEFRNGIFHGVGKAVYKEGDEYIGEWANGLKEGRGKYTFADGSIYKGHFHKDVFEGNGTLNYNNGEKYSGEWKNGKPNGQGIYVFEDNDRYEGNLVNGIMQGYGTMYYSSGKVYSGQWRNGEPTGNENNTIVNSRPSQQAQQKVEPKYEPAPVKEKPVNTAKERLPNCNYVYCQNGRGIYTYEDGSLYTGEFKNGDPDGYGIVAYASGDVYEGYWKNESPNGKGTYTDVDGFKISAIWQNGEAKKILEDEVKLAPGSLRTNYSPEVKIWATVVGVSKYTYMPQLNFPDDDAYKMSAFLQSTKGGALNYDQVQLLVDNKATRKGILTSVQETFAKADANDVALFYFSGHGLNGSLIPIDFNGYQNKIEYTELVDIVKKSKAKQKIIIMDACYSGSMMVARSPYANQLTEFYNALGEAGEGTAIISSSKQQEYSMEDTGLRSGVFSYYMINGMKGSADYNRNGIVTITELFNFVSTNVKLYTGGAQSPQISGDYDKNMPVAFVK